MESVHHPVDHIRIELEQISKRNSKLRLVNWKEKTQKRKKKKIAKIQEIKKIIISIINTHPIIHPILTH